MHHFFKIEKWTREEVGDGEEGQQTPKENG